ncbi:MAG TPA: glycoside hydrolase family 3 C-terminal domain-containing protein [Jatrophihabitantaceae bacterium]
MSTDLDPAALLEQLTLTEKAALCLGSDFWHTAPVERLGIPAVALSDGPHGLRKVPEDGVDVALGESLPATCFPTASALGSSWDVDLAYRIGIALADEARAQGVAVILGPGINIKRSPLCGRNFEYFAEDPVLSGRLATAMIDGIQSRGVGTSLKHFAANNQESDRLRVSADVDERTLREIYLAGFEIAVTSARPWTVMCAYNRVNGVHASQHRWLLTDVLRDEWGFEGLVVSDWGAVHDRVAALAAGLDLEMPPKLGISDVAIVDAVHSGALDGEVLDESVSRVLELVHRARAIEPVDGIEVDAHHELARAAARDCAVLLKNDGPALPLQPSPGQTIAVIGEFARTPRFQGAGSSQVNPTRIDTALDALSAGVPDGVEVAFAAGFRLDGMADDGLAGEAVELARRADAVVVFCGVPAADESEGYDRTHMRLPAEQLDLLPRLAGANASVVLVLANGSTVELTDAASHATAVLETWLSGQAAGGAVADLVLGVANPSGRLAETIPLRLEDNSSYLNFPGEDGHVRYGEGVFVGYRGYDALDQQVAFPFGHGLSYTTFDYADLQIDVIGDAVEVRCTVTNTGARHGKEVVQIYVGDVESSVSRPVRELKAFVKVDLAPGQSHPVTCTLSPRDFSYWSTRRGGWHLEAGEFEIAVGSSSRDLRLRSTVQLTSDEAPLPLDGMSTLQEWLADPAAARLLRAAVVDGNDGAAARTILDNEELQRLIGNFPISSLAAMPGSGLSPAIVTDVVAELQRTR